jgi:Domain of unknown function (DUF4440)
MQRGVEIFAGINLLLVGLSHVFAPTAWKAFFTLLHSKGAAGSILNSLLSIGIGAFVVAFHPGFHGLVPSALTVYGWLLLAKGALYIVFPGIGLKAIETPTRRDARLFIAPGVVMAALGAALLSNPAVRGANAGDEATLLGLERVWNEAHLHDDVEALDRLWDDDLTVTVPAMDVLSKADALAMMRSGRMTFDRYESSDIRVLVEDGSARVTGRIRRRRSMGGRTMEDDWLFTKQYVRRGAGWRVTAFHASSAPGGG